MKLRKPSEVSIGRTLGSPISRILALDLNWTKQDFSAHLFAGDEIKAHVALREIDAPTGITQNSCHIKLGKIVSVIVGPAHVRDAAEAG